MAAAGSFSDLPAEALDEIARRVGPLDNFACSAVCKPWRRALNTARTRRLKQPASRPLYVCVEPRYLSWQWESWANKVCIRPEGHGRPQDFIAVAMDDGDEVGGAAAASARYPTRVIGCSRYGWVVTADKACSLSLLDPLTGRRFPLPPVTSSLGRRSKKLRKDLAQTGQDMFRRAAVAPGRRLGTIAVTLIHGGGHGLSFLAPGAKSWTALRAPAWAPESCCYLDVAFHKGVFYTVSSDAALTAWAPDGSSSGLRARLAVASPRAGQRVWAVLVESPAAREDGLLMASRPVDGRRPLYSGTFEVSRYDERRQGRWVPATSRGDVRILMNDNGGLCVPRRQRVPVATDQRWPCGDVMYTCDSSYDCLFLGYGCWFLPYVAPLFPWN